MTKFEVAFIIPDSMWLTSNQRKHWGRIETAPARVGSTCQGLTSSLDLTKERL